MFAGVCCEKSSCIMIASLWINESMFLHIAPFVALSASLRSLIIELLLAVARRIIGEVKVFNRPDGIYFTCLYCDKQHLLKSKEIIRDQKDFGISMKLLSWDGSWVTIPLQEIMNKAPWLLT